ncbi:hypothetical protein BDR07DRAFT_1493281 [Suillus spraguei]|nr:hypothetical protein BDR07DRAFT_1493281 [Suillus spraguei]
MPPKGRRSGGKKTGTSVVGSVANLQLDTRPVRAEAPENDLGKETQRLDTSVAKCKAGVAWLNILTFAHRFKFGIYNDRPENETETNKLISAFKTKGIVPMKDVTAIPIIISKKRIGNCDALASDFLDPDVVPELKISDQDVIVVASGQHRLSALRKYHRSLQDEKTSLTKKIERIKGLKHTTEDHKVEYDNCRQQLSTVLGTLVDLGKWGIVVYDSDKLLAKGDRLANHLSSNSTLHEYKQTEEEVLVTVLKDIWAAYLKAAPNERDELAHSMLIDVRTEKDKNARLQKVLHETGLCYTLFRHLLQLGSHYRRRREFSVTWLSKSIDICMGVYVVLMESRCLTLRILACQDSFPSYGEITHLLNEAERGVVPAREKLASLRELLTDIPSIEKADISIWADVMPKIDKHAESAFHGVENTLLTMSPTYVEALSKYRSNVIFTLRSVWSLADKKPNEIEENSILKHLDSITARLELHLTPEEDSNHVPEPLLTGWMLDYIWSSLTKIQLAIAEISRWFEPLLDYWRILHGKMHTMDDWSAVMIRNVHAEPRLQSRVVAVQIVDYIWRYRNDMVLQLNNAMLRIAQTMDPRPHDKKSFEAAVGHMHSTETVLCNQLIGLVQARRQKGVVEPKDLSGESMAIVGTLALHVTSWDWTSSKMKNYVRDSTPCVQAIIMERVYAEQYRPQLLADPTIGALRRVFELELTEAVRPKQTLTSNRKLVTVKEWKWHDGLTLDKALDDPTDVICDMHDEFIQAQRRSEERLASETADLAALQKLVNMISNMPGAKASRVPNSDMSADLARPLTDLMQGFYINMSRQRNHLLADNPELAFNVSKDTTVLPVILPPSLHDSHTTGYNDVNDDDAEEDQDEDVIRQLISKKTQGGAKPSQPLTPSTEVFSPSKATGRQDECADDDNEPRDQTTPKAQRSAPKPRPIPRKKRQASPVRAPVEGEARTSPSTSEDTVNTQDNSSDVLSDDGRQDNEALVAPSVVDDTTHDTDIILGDATLPKASDTTVFLPEENMAADKTVLLASQTSSLSLQDHDLLGTIHNSSSAPPTEDDDRPKGCATDDTTWFEQEDVDELATSQSSRAADPDASVEELLATPGPESSKLVPTQPLTQLVEEVSSVVQPAAAPAPAPPATGSSTTKRPRTHTGASSGSSTSGHGKKSQKKKPRIRHAAVDAQDTGADEVVIIPGM